MVAAKRLLRILESTIRRGWGRLCSRECELRPARKTSAWPAKKAVARSTIPLSSKKAAVTGWIRLPL